MVLDASNIFAAPQWPWYGMLWLRYLDLLPASHLANKLVTIARWDEKKPFVWLAEMHKLGVMRETEICLAMTLALWEASCATTSQPCGLRT